MGDAKKNKVMRHITLGVAVLSLVIASLTFAWNHIRRGELVVHEPTGFCIVRGYSEFGFESDHLVIPLVIENTGKGAKIFEGPTLNLTEKTKQHDPVKYKPAGVLPDLYPSSMHKTYEIGFGWHIPENSVVRYFVVFHIVNWSEPAKPEYSKFRFKGGEEWDTSLAYIENTGAPQRWHNGNNNIFFTMPIYSTIDRLEYGGNYNSDCFSLRDASPVLESSR